jgi:hypothetical protein
MLTLFFFVGVFSEAEASILLPFIPLDLDVTDFVVYYAVSRFLEFKVLIPDFLLIPNGIYFPF